MMGPWHQVGDIWERFFGGGIAAYARIWRCRWQVAIAPRPGVPLDWQDYCPTMDTAGGRVCQEYKAKRRATALARKSIKVRLDPWCQPKAGGSPDPERTAGNVLPTCQQTDPVGSQVDRR